MLCQDACLQLDGSAMRHPLPQGWMCHFIGELTLILLNERAPRLRL